MVNLIPCINYDAAVQLAFGAIAGQPGKTASIKRVNGVWYVRLPA